MFNPEAKFSEKTGIFEGKRLTNGEILHGNIELKEIEIKNGHTCYATAIRVFDV